MQAGHSRKDSDDFSKLLFGHDNANPEFSGEHSPMDSSFTEPSLSYRQPKTSLTSFRAFLSRCRSESHRIDNFLLEATRLYVHPAVSGLVLCLAILIPVALALSVIIPDCNKGDCLIIDKSLESFEIPGHISSERNDMVKVAGSLSHKVTESPTLRRRRSTRAQDENPTEKTYQYKRKSSLELVYLAKGDDDLNMLTKERLETVHAIDQSLMSQPGFSDFCWKWKNAKDDPFLDDHCVPPISLINFFYPSRSESLGLEIFDGMGKNEDGTVVKNLTEASIQDTLKLLLTKTFTYWFVDDSFSKDNLRSRFLRAELRFGSPLKPNKPDETHGEQNIRYENFLKGYIEAMKKMSTNKVRLLYGGTDVFDYEVNKTLWADITLAVFTIAFVGFFVLIFTRLSPFLTLFGIISIVTPLGSAYFFFRHVFQVPSLAILSGISAFIIIGIGVDDVFVFINTFRQAESARSLESRMLHTISTAGKATFFTSFTTAMAFFANYFSKMPAIHDFGLLMALIVGSCWFTVFFTIPPALNLWHRYVSKWEGFIFKSLFGWMSCTLGGGHSDLPGDIQQFLSGNERGYSQPASASQGMELVDRSPSEEDDTSLINLDGSSPNSQSPSPSSSDSDLTMFDDPNHTFDLEAPLMNRRSLQTRQGQPHQSHNNGCCRCRCGLQSILYHWLAVPIQKYRYGVLIIFILILG
ncbi:protein dispatched homolog 3-like [Stylophora pistillata]|uniref:protein dispatched homolog 3-like n=1 Tax=Stylophora pistillata TaxID=50429 RepID=UPI000C048844|nr:protein dispatched homolog 3-like [Stylophora pistillata]